METTKQPGAQADGAKAITSRYSFQVTCRPTAIGGGWKLTLFENGQDVGGGAFPAEDAAADEAAYNDALNEGTSWLESRPSAGENVAALSAVSSGKFHCVTCVMVDAVGCQQPDCPDRHKLSAATELKCMTCPWKGVASQTSTFGSVSMRCPECGAPTASAELEESVLAGIAAVAVASADTHPELTAGIVAQIAPDNVDVLDTPAARIAAGLPRAKAVFANLAAAAYARTSLENVQDVLQAIGKVEQVVPALRPTLIGDGTGATRVVPGMPGRCDQSTPLTSDATTYNKAAYNKAAVDAVTELERFAKQCPGADIGYVAQLAVNVQMVLLNLPAGRKEES